MNFRKNFSLFIIGIFLVFAGLSTCCFGDECSDCELPVCDSNNCRQPPCYTVTFSGIKNCDTQEEVWNDTYTLGSYGPSCNWWYADSNVTVSMSVEDGEIVIDYGYSALLTFFKGFGPINIDGEEAEADNRLPYPCGGGFGGGKATYTPDWNCSPCCSVEVSPSSYIKVDTKHESCCEGGHGGRPEVSISCVGASHVIPSYSGEVGGVVTSITSSLPINECSSGSGVKFIVATKAGREKATVKLKAIFFCASGEASGSATVEVIPCGFCCEDENIPKCKNEKYNIP